MVPVILEDGTVIAQVEEGLLEEGFGMGFYEVFRPMVACCPSCTSDLDAGRSLRTACGDCGADRTADNWDDASQWWIDPYKAFPCAVVIDGPAFDVDVAPMFPENAP